MCGVIMAGIFLGCYVAHLSRRATAGLLYGVAEGSPSLTIIAVVLILAAALLGAATPLLKLARLDLALIMKAE
jgi:ABC-type antimicrobial peptide transport system permease subunit